MYRLRVRRFPVPELPGEMEPEHRKLKARHSLPVELPEELELVFHMRKMPLFPVSEMRDGLVKIRFSDQDNHYE
jgi:hypothetical protein